MASRGDFDLQAIGARLSELTQALSLAGVLLEAGVILACAGVAWLVLRRLRGEGARPGLLFGRSVVDGVLFPALLLLLVLVARWAVSAFMPVGLLRLAVPLLLSLLVIRIGAGVLRAALPGSRAVRITERTLSWVVWLGLVLWVTGVLPLVASALEQVTWTLGGTPVSVLAIVSGAFSAATVLVIALWVSTAIEERLLAGVGPSGEALSLRKIAANATRALLLFVGVLLALSAAGIPLGALGVLGGAIGVGIGFGLQKLAANYVSGFVILAERSLRIGDLVKVENFEGRITDIHTRYTVISALNGRESIVPNELLIAQRVENASLADPRLMLQTTVTVAYGTDLEALMPELVQAVQAVPRVVPEPGPSVQLASFGADGLELAIPFWIADPENGQGNVRSEVNRAILRTLVARGVEIPYPQRVVRQV
ncbi:MAG: mechanosensitive ion channel family protein [Rubrivivax sp.]